MISPGEDEEVHDGCPGRQPALQHEADHGAEDDEEGDGGNREDDRVDEGGDEHVVACLDHLDEVLPETDAVLRQRELPQRCLLLAGGKK
jgi:hypothetical protein